MRPTLFAVLFLALGSCFHEEDSGIFTPDDLVGNWICEVDWHFADSPEEIETWEIIFTKDSFGVVNLAVVIDNDFYNILNDSLDPHFFFYLNDGVLEISVDYERVDFAEGFVIRTFEWTLEMDAGANGWTGTQETAFQNFDGGDWWEETNEATVVGVKQ